MKDNMVFLSRKGRESISTCAKCLSCLRNNKRSRVARISGVWSGLVTNKASKLNRTGLVYAL